MEHLQSNWKKIGIKTSLGKFSEKKHYMNEPLYNH